MAGGLMGATAWKTPSGAYFYTTSPYAVSTSITLGNGALRLAPWLVHDACTLTALGAEVTIAGDAGCVLRLVVCADTGSCYPGALVVDAGTIAGDSATVQAVTGLSVALTPNLYWVGAAVQGVTVTQPTVRTQGTWTPPVPMGVSTTLLPGAGGTISGYSMPGVTGAFAGPFTSTITVSGLVPRIFAKVTVP